MTTNTCEPGPSIADDYFFDGAGPLVQSDFWWRWIPLLAGIAATQIWANRATSVTEAIVAFVSAMLAIVWLPSLLFTTSKAAIGRHCGLLSFRTNGVLVRHAARRTFFPYAELQARDAVDDFDWYRLTLRAGERCITLHSSGYFGYRVRDLIHQRRDAFLAEPEPMAEIIPLALTSDRPS